MVGGEVGFPACITGQMTSIQGGLPPGGCLHLGGLHTGWGRSRGSASVGSAFRKGWVGGGGGTHPTGMLSCLI